VTGSAIAIPLLGATGASAASGTTWDQVANCETGGSWSKNSGDGFYGGLHIAQEDWDTYGGLDYAPRPDQASRSQQIAVAEKILADQGVGYWSTCGLLNGLSQDSRAADVDTGVAGDATSGAGSDASDAPGGSTSTDSPGLSGSSRSSTGTSRDTPSDAPSSTSPSTPGGASDATPEASTGTSGDADNSAKSGTSDDSGLGGSQGADSSSTGAANQDDSDNSWRVGAFSSLVDTGALSAGAPDADTSGAGTRAGGKHRGDSADEDASGSAATAASAGRHAARGDAYTVRAGDTLASIADSLDLHGGWRALYEENKAAIGSDPSRIVPGQTLGLGAE
jgi:hypothetical protein